MESFRQIGTDGVGEILQFLKIEDIVGLRLVCRQMMNIVRSADTRRLIRMRGWQIWIKNPIPMPLPTDEWIKVTVVDIDQGLFLLTERGI